MQTFTAQFLSGIAETHLRRGDGCSYDLSFLVVTRKSAKIGHD